MGDAALGVGEFAPGVDPEQFVRIHRSHLVNADRIKELLPANGEHIVVLRNGVRLTLSRGYRDRLARQTGLGVREGETGVEVA